MTQTERRVFLIKYLLRERNADIVIPTDEHEQKRLLRTLMNVRPAYPIAQDFLKIQDEYLMALAHDRGIVNISDLSQIRPDIYLWRGDITRLKCDAIVNAANSALLGCFVPCHGCIDNAIHSAAGIQLRAACNDIMQKQNAPEGTGLAKITPAYNLPSKYVIHTVGPIVASDVPSKRDNELLSACYISCLDLASQNKLGSIAFPCISTGEFHFPNAAAAEIAVNTVLEYKRKNASSIKVIFNVFKELDYDIYRGLLG